MSKPKIYIRDRIYVPESSINVVDVTEEYTYRDYDQMICNKCEFRTQRHCSECDSCQLGGYKGSFCLVKPTRIKGDHYLGFPFGDQDRIEKRANINFNRFKVIDQTVDIPFDYEIKFTCDLYDYQEEPVEILAEQQLGLLESKPRTGKTLMSIAASIRAGYKTIIMADQKDFLDGFYETLEEHTNLLELEEIHGKKLFGFPEKMSDYEDFQFILITYQSLIQDTKACKDRLKALNDNFGALVIDEVHRANATCFASVIGSVWMTMRVALTATVKRKDGRQFLVRNLIGPVVAKTDAEALRPTIVAHKTPKNVTTRSAFKGQAGFTKMCQFLARHKQRQETILEWVKKDLAKGRNIVIPVYFKDNIASLVRDINAMAGEEICAAFVGGAKSKKLRKDIVNRARTGEIRVVVGVRKLLQLGINVPKWDTIYYVMPMNNAPNWEQESCRICTPMPNKPTPLIRMFLDEHVPQALGCFRSTYKQGVTLGYATSKKSARKLERWLGVVQQREQMKDVPDFFAPNFDTTKKKKQEAIGRSL